MRRRCEKQFVLIAVPIGDVTDGIAPIARVELVTSDTITRAEYKAEERAKDWASAVMIAEFKRTVQKPKVVT